MFGDVVMPRLSHRALLAVCAFAGLTVLSGCASLSEEECKTADWRRLGYNDGAAGYAESRIAEHTEACAKIGIRPNAQLWRSGWDQGVVTYCTPSVGWREGLAGRSYYGVCRGRNEEAFLAPYRAGSEIHRLESRINSNHSEIRRLEDQLRSAPNEEARRRLRSRIRDLDSEQHYLRSNLNSLRYGSRY
jgi:Protein of unknown function (DUF2799)